MTVVYVLRIINIFCAALTAGGLMMVLMAVYPAVFLPAWWPFSKKVFEPQTVAEIHRAIDLLPDAYMRPSTVISGLTALIIIIELIQSHRLTSFITTCTVIGLIGTVGVVLTSEFFNVPINRIVHGWKDGYVSPDYPRMLARWGFFHFVRTSSSLLALVCYIMAAVV